MAVGRKQAWGLLALAVAALLYGCWRTWPRTVDDAYITFRHAQNLVEGAGPVFNPGEPVEGCSSPSWMWLSAGAIAAGIDPVPFSKILGVAASVALLSAVYLGLRRDGVVPQGAAIAALLFGSSFVVAIWATAGMETNGYALAFFVGVLLLARERLDSRGVVGASVALAAAALTRPEGLAFWGLGIGVVAWRAEERSGRLRSVSLYLLPGIALAAFFAWRLSRFGHPFPNTYYVKTGGGLELWRQGLHGLWLFASAPSHLPWIGAAALGAIAGVRADARRTGTSIVAGAVLLHLLWVVSVGDDGLRVHRFQMPVLAPMAYLAGAAFRSHRIVATVLSVGAALLSARALHSEVLRSYSDAALAYQAGNERLGRLLRSSLPAGTPIAVAAAGAIPYYSGLPTIDMYGLNDAHIARTPFAKTRGARLMKWDNAYVLSKRPQIIAINRGYFPAGDPMADEVARNPGLLADSPMDRDLFAPVARDGGYRLRAIPFPDGAVFFVFERN